MVQWTTSLLPVTRGPGSNPQGALMWNQDSPVSAVSLHWWPRHDWSLWPPLRRASSRTVTMPSYQQCDDLTWFQTAFLSRFITRCRSSSSFTIDTVSCWGESYGKPAISLHSHHVSLVQWTTGLLPFTRDPGSNAQGGYWCETGILLLAFSRYKLPIVLKL
jgi:hypothetical protein